MSIVQTRLHVTLTCTCEGINEETIMVEGEPDIYDGWTPFTCPQCDNTIRITIS